MFSFRFFLFHLNCFGNYFFSSIFIKILTIMSFAYTSYYYTHSPNYINTRKSTHISTMYTVHQHRIPIRKMNQIKIKLSFEKKILTEYQCLYCTPIVKIICSKCFTAHRSSILICYHLKNV